MICNICGGEIPYGETVCKYCGNVVPANKKKADDKANTIKIEPIPEKPRVSHDDIDVPADATVYRSNSYIRKRYCNKCGRPLAGETQRCIVCEAKEVGRIQGGAYSQRTAEKPADNNVVIKHTGRNIVLSILGLIVVFTIALLLGPPIAKLLGVGGFSVPEKETPTFAVEETQKPKNTWEPERDKETDKPTEKPTLKPTDKPTEKPMEKPTEKPVESETETTNEPVITEEP